ncbi:hypothetical protein QJS10_CPA08g00987 [Acorus calamus]|uniref:Uncharacterized protein n=1 Tax=Acorus calamus TaxID=4465 RepID=A0AAV9E8I4_ACOCL|nr:hypothetical protein QJS10_CPA08g00987 [Acorus calamus]
MKMSCSLQVRVWRVSPLLHGLVHQTNVKCRQFMMLYVMKSQRRMGMLGGEFKLTTWKSYDFGELVKYIWLTGLVCRFSLVGFRHSPSRWSVTQKPDGQVFLCYCTMVLLMNAPVYYSLLTVCLCANHILRVSECSYVQTTSMCMEWDTHCCFHLPAGHVFVAGNAV